MSRIAVSELFYSLQGEGPTMGRPSVFLRLAGCNLLCGGKGTDIDKQLHGGATWRCDTIEVWKKGKSMPIKNLIESLYSLVKPLTKVGLVITGGEPLLQQEALESLLSQLSLSNIADKIVRVEIETNGTIAPKDSLLPYVSFFNVSPKLRNSGMPKELRLTDALFYFSSCSNSCFKYVVSLPEDLGEVEEQCLYYRIPSEKIWLMPACSNREELYKISPLVAELCKKKGYNYSSRLQIEIWNETTGV